MSKDNPPSCQEETPITPLTISVGAALRFLDLGRDFEAIPLLEFADTLEPEDINKSALLNKLGFLFEYFCDYEIAQGYFHRWLNVVDPRRHPAQGTQTAIAEVAAVLSGLGRCHLEQKRYQSALMSFLDARDLWVKAFGEQDENAIMALDELAYVHELMGDLHTAVRLLSEVVDIRERTLGRDHPSVRQSQKLLDDLRRRDGRVQRADWDVALDHWVGKVRGHLSKPDVPGLAHFISKLAHAATEIPNHQIDEGLRILTRLAKECKAHGHGQAILSCIAAVAGILDQTTSFTSTTRVPMKCPVSGLDFAADVYHVIDLDRDPALLTAIRRGETHLYVSPAEADVWLNKPLLLYQRFSQPHFVFVVMEDGTKEENEQARDEVLGIFRTRLESSRRYRGYNDRWYQYYFDCLIAGMDYAERRDLPILFAENAHVRSIAQPLLEFMYTSNPLTQQMAIFNNPLLLTDLVGKSMALMRRSRSRDVSPADWVIFCNSVTEMLKVARTRKGVLRSGMPDTQLEAALTQATRSLNNYLQTHNEDELRMATNFTLRALQRSSSSTISSVDKYRTYITSLQIDAERLRDADEAVFLAAINDHATSAATDAEGDLQKLAMVEDTLSHALAVRYERFGKLTVLEEAIAAAKKALILAEQIPTYKAHVAFNMARRLEQRFARLGEKADIEGAIYYAQLSERLTDNWEYGKEKVFGLLALTHYRRFQLTRHSEDLDIAIEASLRSLDLVQRGTEEEAIVSNNLSNMLRGRYDRQRGGGVDKDRDEALRLARRAVAISAIDSPLRLGRLNTLALRLSKQFSDSGNVRDLDESAEISRGLIESCPLGQPELPGFYNNYGLVLLTLAKKTRKRAHLSQALEQIKKAIELTAYDDPDLARYTRNCGEVLREMARSTRNARRNDFWNSAREQYELAIAQLRKLVATEAELSQIASDAAEYTRELVGLCFEAGQIPELIKALENGRAVQARTEISRAAITPQGLGDEELVVYKEILNEERALRSMLRDGRDRTQLELREGHFRLRELQQLRLSVEEKDPAFNVNALDFEAIRNLAETNKETIVYLQPLSRAESGIWPCTLIVIVSGETEEPKWELASVRNVTPDSLGELIVGLPRRDNVSALDPGECGWFPAYDRWLEASSTDFLWKTVIDRVLKEIGRKLISPLAKKLSAIGARRVTLIPAGLLTVLPLHAAPIDGHTPFGERFETRYVASAALLVRCYDRLEEGSASQPYLTAVVNPDLTLPFADAQVERVAQLFAEENRSIAVGASAGRQWLFEHSIRADFLDLSTHGVFEPQNASQSYFLLASDEIKGGREREFREAKLTLTEIFDGTLRLKEGSTVLANACESGMIDQAFPEEQWGFPMAFLTRGASCVVATFWSVNDLSTALFIERVYRLIIEDGATVAEAAASASKWLRTLSKKEVLAWLTSERATVQRLLGSTSVQTRKDKFGLTVRREALARAIERLNADATEAAPFAHPFYWAPFGVYGAIGPVFNRLGDLSLAG
jgi:CHAT domain-containing protein